MKTIEGDSQAIVIARKLHSTYINEVLGNGDTLRQLLARARYLLHKPQKKWRQDQREREGDFLLSLPGPEKCL